LKDETRAAYILSPWGINTTGWKTEIKTGMISKTYIKVQTRRKRKYGQTKAKEELGLWTGWWIHSSV
jgi:hypothetical protein